MRSLLEADDRLLGIRREVKARKKTIFTWLFIDEDKEYKDGEYRNWLISQLIDGQEFLKSFSFSHSLGSHKTKYFELKYILYFLSNPKKQFKQFVEEER